MDVIVIGAGAAGLMAAKQLSNAGLKVCLLEARNRLGGRIHSLKKDSLEHHEGGAEFIHGNLELTLQLLEEAGLKKQQITGQTWQVINNQWSQENEFFAHAEKVIEQLKLVEEDCSIASFLDKFFSGEHFAPLRKSITSYIEGYYSGEISMTSAKTFLQEWLSEDDQQYRPTEGYGKMIRHLAEYCQKKGTVIKLQTVVRDIRWSKDKVEITDEGNNSYLAKKAVITVPLGIWTADENAKGAIQYIPELPRKKAAAKQMGFGAVIKVLLKFEEKFFDEELLKVACKDLSMLHMIITDNPIPTWWTQHPNRSSLLTGWLSGPKAYEMKNEDDDTVLSLSLQSLKETFGIDDDRLKSHLQWFKIFNWTADPFTRGSYSYSTLHSSAARKVLSEPIENTLFFGGEALYDGPEMGTVEAALTSGKDVAAKILSMR